MGCDIHPYVETKGKDGKWHPVLPVGNDPRWTTQGSFQWDFDRSYDSFGVMAGVRNGTYGDDFHPISEPKGLPEDVSSEIKKRSDDWAGDGHSHSWLTLKEIYAYDWDNKIHHSAVVEKEYAKTLAPGEAPQGYCAWSSSPTAVTVEWDETYRAAAEVLLLFVDKVKKAAQDCDPESVRLVFWFDN